MTPTAAELAEIRNTEYMPILMGNSGGPPAGVPWAVICAHEKQAQANHGQTLRGLANRGGLSWCEMLAVLEDRKWRKMDADHAQRAVLNHVSIFFRAALLSILDAREPDWQPIETAPKDGTPVDLWMKSGGRLTNVLWVSVVPAEILHNDCWMPGWKYSALEFQIMPEEQFSHWRHVTPPISGPVPASEPANQEKA